MSIPFRTRSPYLQKISGSNSPTPRDGSPQMGEAKSSSRPSSPQHFSDHHTLPRIMGAHYADNDSTTAAFKNAGRDRALYANGSVVCDRPELTLSHMGPGIYDHKSDFVMHTNIRPTSRGGSSGRAGSPLSKSRGGSPSRPCSPSARKLTPLDTATFAAPHSQDYNVMSRSDNNRRPRTAIGVDIEVDVGVVAGIRNLR